MASAKLLRKKQIRPTLALNVAQSGYTEYLRSGNFVTDIIIWTSALKSQKIWEQTFTYSNNRPSTIVSKRYDSFGVLLETLTESLVYSGNNLDNTTSTLT